MDEEDLNALPHTGAPTSAEAAQSMVDAAIGIRLRIMQQLVVLEPEGSIPDTMQRLLGFKHQTNSPRFSELADDGLVYDTGDQRPTRSGRGASVWRPTPFGIKAILEGWYHGERLTKEKRDSYVGTLRAALAEALRGWAANTIDPDQLARIATLEPLTKPSSRRRGGPG